MHDELSINTLILYRTKGVKVHVLFERVLTDLTPLLSQSDMGRYLLSSMKSLNEHIDESLAPDDRLSVETFLHALKNTPIEPYKLYTLGLHARRCIDAIRRKRAVLQVPTHIPAVKPDSMKSASLQDIIDKTRRRRYAAMTTRLHVPSRIGM